MLLLVQSRPTGALFFFYFLLSSPAIVATASRRCGREKERGAKREESTASTRSKYTLLLRLFSRDSFARSQGTPLNAIFTVLQRIASNLAKIWHSFYWWTVNIYWFHSREKGFESYMPNTLKKNFFYKQTNMIIINLILFRQTRRLCFNQICQVIRMLRGNVIVKSVDEARSSGLLREWFIDFT